MKLPLFLIAPIVALIYSPTAHAEVQARTVEYKHGNTVLEGYLAYDDDIQGKRPGVMVVHEWTGLGPYVQQWAKQLAELGYVAFAVDMYGKGIRPKNDKEAAAQASIYRSDRKLMRVSVSKALASFRASACRRLRAAAGLKVLQQNDLTDKTRIAAIGYCFGSGTVLELARSGADVDGVVSFHGNLDTPNPNDARNIKGKVLVLHGAEDPLVPPEQVLGFAQEMSQAKVDWQMIAYGNAVHSFTNPNAANDKSKGVAYNPLADKRSFADMRQFFAEIFQLRTP